MKLKITSALVLVMALFFSSCSKDGNEEEMGPIINPDLYIRSNLGQIHDIYAVDNQLYYLVYESGGDGEGINSNLVSFKRMTLDGKPTLMNSLMPTINFARGRGSFIIANDGTPISISDRSGFANTVFRFRDNQTDLLTREIASLTSNRETRFSTLESLNDSTFVAFDQNAHVLRAFTLNANERDYSLGKIEKDDIIDGIGEEAAFRHISKIIRVNEILYAIDDETYVRAIEKTPSGLKVTTIGDSKLLGDVNDITFDKANNQIIASINGTISSKPGGLYAFDLSGDTFTELTSGTLSLDLSNHDKEETALNIERTNWGWVDHMQVIGDDLYFVQNGRFIKISDYRTKIR